MLLVENNLNFNIDETLLEKILDSLSQKDVELLIVCDKEMRKLNLNHRNIDKSTDVLSFPLAPCEFAPLGSIIINKDKALGIAKDLNHTQEEEVALLFIHGLLHLLGFDHEEDKGEMRVKEIELIKKFNLPKSLIIRSES